MWTPRGKKFDNRVYMLIPSIHPLTALFRVGHLRFSVFNYTERFESTFALNRTGRSSKWMDKVRSRATPAPARARPCPPARPRPRLRCARVLGADQSHQRNVDS
jgi:hypothetical protein